MVRNNNPNKYLTKLLFKKQSSFQTSYKYPGLPISRSKMSKLKDSAILTLNDFSRIKETSKPLSIYTSTASNLSKDNENFYMKALHHKNKILSYDKQKKIRERLNTYDGSKLDDPYNKVSRTDDAVQAMEQMCLNAKVYTVRDQQKKERKLLDDMYKKKEAKIDLMQEMERLKDMLARASKNGTELTFEEFYDIMTKKSFP